MALAQLVAQAVPFVTAVWIADQLNESDFGAYRLMLVLMGYIAYSTLGAELRVMYKLPEAIGGSRIDEVKRMLSILHSFLIFNRVLVMIIFILLGSFSVFLNGVSIGQVWFLAGMVVALDGWSNLYEIILRSYQRYLLIGVIRILSPLIYLISIFFFLKYWEMGMDGVFYSLIISGLFKLLLCWKFSKQSLQFNWDVRLILDYIKFGFPLKVNSFVWMMITTLNLWLSSFLLSPIQTGTLGFAMIFCTAYVSLSGVLSEVTSVKFITYLGKSGGADQLEKRHEIVYQGSIGWVIINLLIVLMDLTAAYLVTEYYLPKYAGSWIVLCILLLGYYTYGVVDTIGNALIMMGQSLYMMKVFIVVLLIQLFLLLMLYMTMAHLTLIEMCIVQVFCIMILSSLIAARFFNLDDCIYLFLRLCGMVGVGVGVIIVFSSIIIYYEFDYIHLLEMLGIVLLLSLPFLLLGYKKFMSFWHNISV